MESREGVVMENENAKIELDFSVGKQGNDGKSAYQIAVDNGYQGSEAEWIESFMRVKTNSINITTEEIISLRDNNKLIPSQAYRVTDYISHYDEFEIESAKHPYDLIVTANSLNTFFEDAKAAIHEGDVYFANNDLSKWQLKIDNNLKVIWMKDEFNNEAPYDFKNVLFPVLYGDEMLSLYTFSIDGNDYSLNPTAESVVGTEIEIAYTIGMCENNVIKGSSIPEGFQGVCVISQSTYAINNEILTGIENNRINLDKEVNFIVLNSWGTASNNNVNIDNGSNVYIPQVRGFNENTIRGLVNIDCTSYTLEQHYDLMGTFSSNIIIDSKVRNKGSFNYLDRSICETNRYNLNIQLDNCKITSCTWKINVAIDSESQVHLFDNLTAVNSDFILNYRSNPDLPTTGEVFLKPDGDWCVGDKVQWYVSYIPEPIRVTEEEFQTLVDNSQLVPGQQYRIIDYTLRVKEATGGQMSLESAGHYFDIIVTASSPNDIELKAKADHHEGDTYFANNKLNFWELEVRLTKNTIVYSRIFDNPISITFMKDEFYNEVFMDFKNVRYSSNSMEISPSYIFTSTTDNSDLSVSGGAFYNKIAPIVDGLNIIPMIILRSGEGGIILNNINGMCMAVIFQGNGISSNTINNPMIISVSSSYEISMNIIENSLLLVSQDISFVNNIIRNNMGGGMETLAGEINNSIIEDNYPYAGMLSVINSTLKNNKLSIWQNDEKKSLLTITNSVIENSYIACNGYQTPATMQNSHINGTFLDISSTCTIDRCVAPYNSHIKKTDDTTLTGKIFMLTPLEDSNPQYYAALSDADFYNYMKTLE